MASLSTSLLGIRRSSSKSQDKTKNAVFCKKHPKHRQSPGVCSLCLNEKLSLFIKASSSSSSSRRQRVLQVICSSSTTSSLSSYCSSSVSSCPSPLVDRRCYLLMAGGGGSGRGGEKGVSLIKKSRSVAYKVDDVKRKETKKTKSSGFFFGLVGSRRENN